MCQVRPTEASASRAPSASLRMRVARFVKALPYGFVSLTGRRTASTSSTAFARPSTIMSRRAENRCWWYGAPSPGATSLAVADPST